MEWKGEYFSVSLEDLAREYAEVDRLMSLSAGDTAGKMMEVLFKIGEQNHYAIQFMTRFSVSGGVTCVFKHINMW
jgi:hypothetical protein